MAKFLLEIDVSHEAFRGAVPGVRTLGLKAVAKRLREVADRLDASDYDAMMDGVIRAPGFVPSECGKFVVVP